jgi:pimeloyl-ACP methyl ester carboxylesterase
MKTAILIVLLLLFHSVKAQFSETIPVTRSGDIENLRNEIRDYVFGDDTIPELSMDMSTNKYLDVFSKVYSRVNIASFETGTVNLKHGFISKICFFHPQKSNGLGIPIIYHTGHGFGMLQEDLYVNYKIADEYHSKVIDFFLSRGYDVIGIDMPLYGANVYPAEVIEHGTTIPIYGHNALFNLEHPFYYFMAPLKSVIDYLEKEKGWKQFVMVGLSGGGWTTTLYSAMDERITLSFPVAGSIPISLRKTEEDKGDLEQNYPDFYDRFNYSTLYFLAAAGKGRRQFQILNQKDNCCFAINGNNYWSDNIKTRLRRLHLPGSYEFYLDTISQTHRISTASLNKISDNIISYMADERLKNMINLSSSRKQNFICDNDTLLLYVPANDINKISWYRNAIIEEYDTAYDYIVKQPGKYFALAKNLSGAFIYTDTIQINQSLQYKKPVIRFNNGLLNSSYPDNNQWYLNGKMISQENNQINAQQPGTYTVKVVSGNCSSDVSDPYEIRFRLFPNPANEYVNVQIPDDYGIVQYSIYDVSGILIGKGEFHGQKSMEIPPGVYTGWYYLKLTGSHGMSTVIKFRVNK